MNKICCIFNLAPHYRAPIYSLMDDELLCDFYFGTCSHSTLKQMDCCSLNGFKQYFEYVNLFGKFYKLQEESLLVKQSYSLYIITGDPFCVSTWLFLFISKLNHKKTILWSHGWYGNENFIKKIFKKLFFGMSNAILLYGNYARNLMIKNGFNENKLYVVHNSLDYNKQKQIREFIKKSNIYRQHFNNDNHVLLFIGRLTPVKKLNLLIDAVKCLLKKGEVYNVVLVGDGEMRHSLEKQVIKNNLENHFWFYGESYDETVNAELIYNADLCVSPGNVGLTAIHCLTFGTPVATHSNFHNQMPEFEAILKGKTGFFFNEDDVYSMTETIQWWFNQENYSREVIRENCYKEIDSHWTPEYQISVIKRAIADIEAE